MTMLINEIERIENYIFKPLYVLKLPDLQEVAAIKTPVFTCRVKTPLN